MVRTRTRSREACPVNLALFDASALVGKGVKTHLVERHFPAGDIRLFETGAVEEGGNLTEFDGEAKLAVRPELKEMEQVDIAFFCGAIGSGEKFLDWPQKGQFVAIDLTSSANSRAEIPVVNASVNMNAAQEHHGLLASPHPASQLLSTFLAPLHQHLPVAEVVTLVMQPASEAGERGIEELYQQTIALLNFAEAPKEQLGRVLAFNLVPVTLGQDGARNEELVVREVSTILKGKSFPHALRILLAPVFHCHTFASRVQFAEEVPLDMIRKVLSKEPTIRLQEGTGGATPAELAGEKEIVLGEIRVDPSVRGGVWFWGIADNLVSGTALNAVRIAEELVRSGRVARQAQ